MFVLMTLACVVWMKFNLEMKILPKAALDTCMTEKLQVYWLNKVSELPQKFKAKIISS
jgi:hypothetical protein